MPSAEGKRLRSPPLVLGYVAKPPRETEATCTGGAMPRAGAASTGK
jgi:hypothetical protein